MEKSTIYLIIAIIISVTVLLVTGEYFIYKYNTLSLAQRTAQTTTSAAGTTTQSSLNSSDTAITSFTFTQLDPAANGIITESNHTISITVPYGTDVTSLAPAIEVSEDATVLPASNTPENFTNPVTYTVTAQGGGTEQYIVTVTVTPMVKNSVKTITSFTLSGFTPEVDGTIDNSDHTIYVIVPDGTDLSNLTPIIEVSDGATILPNSNIAQDFTSPVVYIVTAQDGSTQSYVVTVVTESNSG